MRTAEHISLQRIYAPVDVGWSRYLEMARKRNHICKIKISIMITIIIIMMIKAPYVHTHVPDATE